MAKTVAVFIIMLMICCSNATENKKTCNKGEFFRNSTCFPCPNDTFIQDEDHTLTKCYPICENVTTELCQKQEIYLEKKENKPYILKCQATGFTRSLRLLYGAHEVDGKKFNKMNFKPSLSLEYEVMCGVVLMNFKCEVAYDKKNVTLVLDQEEILRHERQCGNKKTTTPVTNTIAVKPTTQHTIQASKQPTIEASNQPTTQASKRPTIQPTLQASNQPTIQASNRPTTQASNQPTILPSTQSTIHSTIQPSNQPTIHPPDVHAEAAAASTYDNIGLLVFGLTCLILVGLLVIVLSFFQKNQCKRGDNTSSSVTRYRTID